MQTLAEYLKESLSGNIVESFWMNTTDYSGGAKKQHKRGHAYNVHGAPESKAARKRLHDMLLDSGGKVTPEILKLVQGFKRKNEETQEFKDFIQRVYDTKATIKSSKNLDGDLRFGDL